MQLSEVFAILFALMATSCYGLSAPEIMGNFTMQVQPRIDAIHNTAPQNATPQDLHILAYVISSAAISAKAQLGALKGQPFGIVFGINVTAEADAVKAMNTFVQESKASTRAIRTSVSNLFSTALSKMRTVSRFDIGTLTTDLSGVTTNLDGLLAGAALLGGDTGQL